MTAFITFLVAARPHIESAGTNRAVDVHHFTTKYQFGATIDQQSFGRRENDQADRCHLFGVICRERPRSEEGGRQRVEAADHS
jgi:hypothetical protein